MTSIARITIAVTASTSQCSWASRSEADWLSIVQGSQGTGTGQVIYEARATTGPSRSGSMVIAGHRVAVRQGDGCAIAIAPASLTAGASGGSASVSVTTAATCSWSARSEASWVAIAAGASFHGGPADTRAAALYTTVSRIREGGLYLPQELAMMEAEGQITKTWAAVESLRLSAFLVALRPLIAGLEGGLLRPERYLPAVRELAGEFGRVAIAKPRGS